MGLLQIILLLCFFFFLRFCIRLYLRIRHFKRFVTMQNGKTYSRVYTYQSGDTGQQQGQGREQAAPSGANGGVIEAEYKVINRDSH